ncbi:peptide chain release factor N(5)-glutamine methyltransferase [Candidatus Dojkabacteria bacterium]|uniref:peptide chain release factor N(5)-glutamine methyltransferase n=1 Tax=Candidatus Dojkabacteria bacterium TaxID=2099670 RepID=A0A955L5A9_9BACT|nr:peptide chain release factor N(5)-glutamine methyltransferase [Candidatus Dojkabacteria bacterium]
MDIREALSKAAEYLIEITDSPILEAELLLAYSLEVDKYELITKSNRILTDKEFDHFWQLIKDRKSGKPVAYILERKEFFGLDFIVTKDVLIPRPETEILIELSIEYIEKHKAKSLLDLGTGSGCIPITLLYKTELEQARAVDISNEAIEIAQRNAKSLLPIQKQNRIGFQKGDILNYNDDTTYDLITSNPPYIPSKELADLPIDLSFEPRSALDGKEDGLTFYRYIAQILKKNMKKTGAAFLEIHSTLAEQSIKIFNDNELQSELYLDLANKPRVIKVTFK